ncbi:F-box domain-containing protein [Mycena venus]|uniref:F-box domain-containing protein n=1 Tax=Mycena venus TaxID=2733690 RepID=A0A8H6YVH9_9AGAR|nr:F-box domain-containing protein [Mycena venus]
MATTASISVRTAILEQAARIAHSSNAHIKYLIEESESRIRSMEAQPQEAALFEQLAQEHVAAAALRHLIAPIRTLPAELLAEIFLLATAEERPAEPPLERSPHFKNVFWLSHVCSEWRQVAVGMPRLWTAPITVQCCGDNRPGDEIDAHFDGLKAWLANSAPLCIPLCLRGDETTSRILAEVLKTAPPWRDLHLARIRPQTFRRITEGPLESLEVLNLLSIYGIEASDFGRAPSFPRLRKLHMATNPSFPMPWSQLTELELFRAQGDWPELALDILARCSALVTVSINIAGWDAPPPPSSDPITLAYLRILRLRKHSLNIRDEGSHLTPFLDYLSASALKELYLSSTADTLWRESQFTAFQLRSPNMTRLEINNAFSLYMTWDNLRAALVHSPSLTHLTLNCTDDFEDTFIGALAYRDGVESLVPRLHHLSLTTRLHHLTADMLVGTITSRWWTDEKLASSSASPVARWAHVQLWLLQGKFDEHFMEITKDFQEMGVLELIQGHH